MGTFRRASDDCERGEYRLVSREVAGKRSDSAVRNVREGEGRKALDCMEWFDRRLELS